MPPLPLRALAPLLAAGLLLALSCGGSSSSPGSSPTAERPLTPTPGPSGQRDGFDGFRRFAKTMIDGPVQDRDLASIVERAEETTLECSGEEETGPCSGRPAGTSLSGIASKVEETDLLRLYSRDEYLQALEDWFATASEDTPAVLAALSHRPESDDAKEAYQAIVSGIFIVGEARLRQARILEFQYSDGFWRLSGELYAAVPESALPWLHSQCEECYDQWERWPASQP